MSDPETISSTALSVSVTRSDAAILPVSVREGIHQPFQTRRRKSVTIYFGVDRGGVGGCDHLAGLLGQPDEKIMDFLKIRFRHR